MFSVTLKIFHCLNTPLFIHYPVEQKFGKFTVFVITNNVSMNIFVYVIICMCRQENCILLDLTNLLSVV